MLSTNTHLCKAIPRLIRTPGRHGQLLTEIQGLASLAGSRALWPTGLWVLPELRRPRAVPYCSASMPAWPHLLPLPGLTPASPVGVCPGAECVCGRPAGVGRRLTQVSPCH